MKGEDGGREREIEGVRERGRGGICKKREERRVGGKGR